MADPTAKVRIQLSANAKGAISEIDKLKSSVAGITTSKGWKNLVTGAGVGVGIDAVNAITGAVKGFAGTIGEGVRAAAEEEAGIARLGAALRANVPAWDGNAKAIEDVIAQRRKMAFSDDDLRQSFGSIVAATHDVSKAFYVQQTAMDLARFKGISLAEASDALVKVEGGQYRMLKSLGIVLKDGATQTDALAAVQKVAAGQAQSYADSSAGAFAKLTDSFDELKEKIGKGLLPVLKPVIEGLTTLAESNLLVPGIAAVTTAIGFLAIALNGAAIAAALASGGTTILAAAAAAGAVGLGTWLIAAGDAADATSAYGSASNDALDPVRKLGAAAAASASGTETHAKAVERANVVIREHANLQEQTAEDVIASQRAQAMAVTVSAETLRGAASRVKDDLYKIPGATVMVTTGINDLKDSVTALGDAMRASASATAEYAKRLTEGLPDVADAVALLRKTVTDGVSPKRLLLNVAGVLASKEYADGLKSKRPEVVAAAVAVGRGAIAALAAIVGPAYAAGAEAYVQWQRGWSHGSDIGNTALLRNARDFQKLYSEAVAQFQGETPGNLTPPDTTALAAATDDVKTFGQTAKDAIASLKGLGGTLTQLVATFSSSWTPTVLTSAQAGAALQASLGKVQTALSGLRVGVESTRAKVASAFAAMQTAASNYFAAIHNDRLRDLADQNSAIQRGLSAQIAAINAGVQAQRDAIAAVRQARQEGALREALLNAQGSYSDPLKQQLADLRKEQAAKDRANEEARLKDAVARARTRADRKAAQDALDAYYERVRTEDLQAQVTYNDQVSGATQDLTDFLADQGLARLEASANAQVAELQAAQQHQTDLYNAQVEGENARYAAQQTALQTMFTALGTALTNMKGVWTSKNKDVLKLLNTFTGDLKTVAGSWVTAMQAQIDAMPPLVIPAPIVGTATASVTSSTTTSSTTKTSGTTATKAMSGTSTKSGTTTTTTSSTGINYSGKVGQLPMMAEGGTAKAGETIIVGEKGPEVLRLGRLPGTVIPNDKAFGGISLAQLEALLGRFTDALRQAVTSAVATLAVTVRQAMPDAPKPVDLAPLASAVAALGDTLKTDTNTKPVDVRPVADAVGSLAGDLRDALASAPRPEITVAPTPVTVAAPDVTVTAPAVDLAPISDAIASANDRLTKALDAQVAPVVNVTVPPVTVAAPDVTVTLPSFDFGPVIGAIGNATASIVSAIGDARVPFGQRDKAERPVMAPPQAVGRREPDAPSRPSGEPVQVNLVVDGKTLARVVDERLFYAFRTAARTGSAL